jgi:hypothetical protein
MNIISLLHYLKKNKSKGLIKTALHRGPWVLP